MSESHHNAINFNILRLNPDRLINHDDDDNDYVCLVNVMIMIMMFMTMMMTMMSQD